MAEQVILTACHAVPSTPQPLELVFSMPAIPDGAISLSYSKLLYVIFIDFSDCSWNFNQNLILIQNGRGLQNEFEYTIMLVPVCVVLLLFAGLLLLAALMLHLFYVLAAVFYWLASNTSIYCSS